MGKKRRHPIASVWTRRRWLRQAISGTSASLLSIRASRADPFSGTSEAPHLWIPGDPRAVGSDAAGAIEHLIYIRLSGGFRFTAAFNAAVDGAFNPFGVASSVASGTQWGVSSLLAGPGNWLDDDRRALGLQSVDAFSNEIAVLTCVDHEPEAASADGNHQTGLERFSTGFVGGQTGLFTLLNYGLRERGAAPGGGVQLPALIMGQAGMGRGIGKYSAYRPPVLRGGDLGGFAKDDRPVPRWAAQLSLRRDEYYKHALGPQHQSAIDALIRAKEATQSYKKIFASDILAVDRSLSASADGITNRELQRAFGSGRESKEMRLALRLFAYGCPAVYIDQGGYDFHSDEEQRLPGRIESLNHLLSALRFALKRMKHPKGGSYWDRTLVVLGSEFSRTTHGRRFNSARGSDHGGDLATRWMSMPMMGGPLSVPGRQLGRTRRQDLRAQGKVYSYRALMRSLMLGVGADVSDIFPKEKIVDDFLVR